jgi:hypothetical protein
MYAFLTIFIYFLNTLLQKMCYTGNPPQLPGGSAFHDSTRVLCPCLAGLLRKPPTSNQLTRFRPFRLLSHSSPTRGGLSVPPGGSFWREKGRLIK